MSEEKPAGGAPARAPAPAAAQAPASAAASEGRRTVEAHAKARALNSFDEALVRAHKRYAVGQLVTDEAFDAALAEARGIELR